MNIDQHIHTQFAGRFKFEAVRIDDDGQEHRRLLTDKEWIDNLITDFGMNAIGTAGNRVDPIGSVQVGSGSTAPAFSDTNLVSLIATKAGTVGGYPQNGNGVDHSWRRWQWRFGQGVAAGNLAEVGVGTGSGSGNLFSRALILDGSGNPTTITVLATEFLDVTYEIRLYWPSTTDVVTTETIQGASYTVTRRPYLLGENERWRNNLPACAYYTDLNSGYFGHAAYTALVNSTTNGTNTQYATSVTKGAYTAGNFYLDITSVFGIATANIAGGIGMVALNTSLGAFQYGFSPKIPKDNTKQLTITTRHSWSRYTP